MNESRMHVKCYWKSLETKQYHLSSRDDYAFNSASSLELKMVNAGHLFIYSFLLLLSFFTFVLIDLGFERWFYIYFLK